MSGSRGGATNPWLIAVVVTLGAFMEVLDTTIVNVALPHIAGSLAVSEDESTWALTTYLVANAIVLTISNSFSVRVGRARYFLICIAGFTATSFMCGISTSFTELLMFRALQGFFGGGLQPMQQAILLDTFPPEKRQAAFSITAIATIVAPVLGPVLGGILTDIYSWHWIFLVNVPVGTFTFFGVLALVKDPPEAAEEAKNAPPFDYIGVLFIGVALGFMEVGVDRGEDLDWLGSPLIRVILGCSALGFLFGIPYLLTARHPVVDLTVFKDRNFALGWAAIGLMGFVLYESAVLIPQFAQVQLGYTATWAGFVLAPGGVVLILLIPVVGLLSKLIPMRFVIALGGLALSGSLFLSEQLVPNLDFLHMCLYRMGQTAALSLLFVPISTAAYVTLPKEQHGDGAALFTMARNVLGGIGISVSTALVDNHLQMRQQDLVQHLAAVNQPYDVLLQNIANASVSFGQSIEAAAASAPGQVWQMLQTQVAVLAYNDVYFISACLALLLVPVGLSMSAGRNTGQQGHGGE